ncbi:MAG: porin [bacterium]
MKKLLAGLLVFTFFAIGNSRAGETDVLLNKLVEKGYLNAAESQEVRTETQNNIDAAKKLEKEEKDKEAKEKGPFYVKIGKGDVKISGYVQSRFERFEKPGKNDEFRVKSVTLALAGKLADDTNFKAEIDASKTDGKILNDAFLKYTLNNYANITLGQFKIPFSEEFITSSSSIETVERSLPVTSLSQERDRGLMLDGTVLNKMVNYGAGIFNGAGPNASEDNEGKDAAGRVVVNVLPGLSIGGSYMTGSEMQQTDTYSTTSADSKTGMFKKTSTYDPYKRTRSGALVKYEDKSVKIQGEYITQKKDYELASKTDISGKGYYALLAYKISLEGKAAIQPVVKYETYDADTDKDNDKQKITTIGVNWFINDYVKLMVNDRMRKDDAGKEGYDELLVQAQVKF